MTTPPTTHPSAIPRSEAVIQAWIYPAKAGDPACSAAQEFSDGRHIDVLKPQYFTLQDTGVLVPIPADQCNSASAANVAAIKAHSHQQFITISGTITGITALTQARRTSLTTTLLAFLATTGFTGVEWDIEDFSSWTPEQYTAYKAFLTTMGTMLHSHGYQLMVDGPSIINTTYQGYYPNFRYEDFESLPIDKIVIMCYDFQNDQGNGTPVASLPDITGCCQWMRARISNPARVVIGINSYGYSGLSGAYTAKALTSQQLKPLPGFSTAQRDTISGELMWTVGSESYDYSDRLTLDGKLAAILAQGYSQVSVWHLGGGNPWFSSSSQDATPMAPATPAAPADPTSAPIPAPSPPDTSLMAFDRRYLGFSNWYDAHFDANGTYHA